MSALAKFLLSAGKTVAGSDAQDGVYVRELRDLGVKIYIGEERRSVKDYDVIVYTDAIKPDDFQLLEAAKSNKTIISRGQLLYEVSRVFKHVIAVSGCHGKTTCTSMLAHVFSRAGKSFGVHIGGRDKKFSNFHLTGNEYFITEACEYKKNFLLLKPEIAVILNSEPDHLECYGSMEKLLEAYASFASFADTSITRYGDNFGGITFGYNKKATLYAKNITCEDGLYCFSVCEGNVNLGEIRLNVYGKHNILNALAVVTVCLNVGMGFDVIAQGIADFDGVERRFERLGEVNGAVCIADYAHHPSEIRATLQAARKIAKGKLITVFQPHTYSRTKNLFKDFVKVLSPLNKLLIYRTFPAREYFDDAGSALTLSQAVKRSVYGDSAGDIKNFIDCAEEGDVVLFLGAGNIYDIAKQIINS